MPWLKWCWTAVLLLGLGLATAAPARTEEAASPASESPAPTAAAEKTPPAAAETPAASPASPPAAKPPSRPARKAKPLKRFRPSEEIHVDKEVDFPSDI